jgi:L-alanine-DL-glutamate epimerase-like enolase superfamily enzyme
VFEGLRTLVVGEDPFEAERLWDKIYRGTIYYGRRGVALQVLSGFDIACHDLMGKATGRPLHKLLGGARRDRVRAYASTLFRPTPDAMRRASEFYMSRGFTAVKFGWGVFGQDRKRDIARSPRARAPGRTRRCSGPGLDGESQRARRSVVPRAGALRRLLARRFSAPECSADGAK